MQTHYYKLNILRDHILNPVESLIYNISSDSALRSKDDMIDHYLNYINIHKSECKSYTSSKTDINKAISNLVGLGYLREINGNQISRALSYNK